MLLLLCLCLGHDGTICLRSVEVYDPLDGNWQPAQHMNYPRDSAAATSFEDKLYMIGGHNGENYRALIISMSTNITFFIVSLVGDCLNVHAQPATM